MIFFRMQNVSASCKFIFCPHISIHTWDNIPSFKLILAKVTFQLYCLCLLGRGRQFKYLSSSCATIRKYNQVINRRNLSNTVNTQKQTDHYITSQHLTKPDVHFCVSEISTLSLSSARLINP
jgi:hypothetical protein